MRSMFGPGFKLRGMCEVSGSRSAETNNTIEGPWEEQEDEPGRAWARNRRCPDGSPHVAPAAGITAIWLHVTS